MSENRFHIHLISGKETESFLAFVFPWMGYYGIRIVGGFNFGLDNSDEYDDVLSETIGGRCMHWSHMVFAKFIYACFRRLCM